MGASKAGGGWQQSIDNHMIMTAGNDKGQEGAVDDEGNYKEGKGGKGNGDGNEGAVDKEGNGGKGHGVGNEGGVQRRLQW